MHPPSCNRLFDMHCGGRERYDAFVDGARDNKRYGILKWQMRRVAAPASEPAEPGVRHAETLDECAPVAVNPPLSGRWSIHVAIG